MSDDLIEVHVTAGSLGEAESISDALVSGGLAACVQTVPGSRRQAYAEWLRRAVGDDSHRISDQTEIERKFTVTDVAEVGEARTHDLHATYFDSDDVRLARRRAALRRRTGGDDDGWHLKLTQEGDGRLEKRLPSGSSMDDGRPPAELLHRAPDFLDGVVVQAACEIDTHRVERDLMREDGTALGARCDDHVQTRNLRNAPQSGRRRTSTSLWAAGIRAHGPTSGSRTRRSPLAP